MSSRKNKLNTWAFEPSRSAPISAENVGRKLLEKMGWESGLGLGKDNQGMVENPLWKKKNPLSREGFKSKEEMAASEILPHQSAFEDLLGELNEGYRNPVEAGELPRQITHEKVQKSKNKVRYFKMSQAKDVRNYSVKDFNGIIGKDVTKKNLNLLCDNRNVDGTSYVERHINASSKMSVNCSDIGNSTPNLKVKDKYPENPNSSLLATSMEKKVTSKMEQVKSQKKRKKQSILPTHLECFSTDSEISINLEQSYVYVNSSLKPVYVNNDSDLQCDKLKTSQHCDESESKNSKRKKDKNKTFSSDYIDQDAAKCRSVLVECGMESGLSPKVKYKRNIYNQQQLAHDPELLSQICEAFVGSNLSEIKGYGNW